MEIIVALIQVSVSGFLDFGFYSAQAHRVFDLLVIVWVLPENKLSLNLGENQRIQRTLIPFNMIMFNMIMLIS